jgi:mono/diheme cytochrome c family protein
MVPKKKRSIDSSKTLSFCYRNSILLFCLFVTACASDEEVKYEQYVISGAEIYKKNCSNCHGLDGSGLRNLYPPIKGSNYLSDKNKLVCIIKNGLQGPINVAGKTYNQKMPAAKGLYDLDIAQLITFLNNKWGSSKKIVEVGDVVGMVCE